MTVLDNVYVAQICMPDNPMQVYQPCRVNEFLIYHGKSDSSLSSTKTEEGDVLLEMWTALVTLHPQAILAGWKLSSLTFPLLVKRSIRLGVPIPPQFKADPEMRYSNVRTMDLCRIYTQSSGAYLPNDFTVEKALEEWGIEVDPARERQLALAVAQYQLLERYYA
jgi:hypothetical protein